MLTSEAPAPSGAKSGSAESYQIGPFDTLRITVDGNPNLSGVVVVRPDGRITTPLVEDLMAANKTPVQLGHAIEDELRSYILAPNVSVEVLEAIGPTEQRIRIVGSAGHVGSVAYRTGMTALDVVIETGGLSPFADANDAVIFRQTPDRMEEIPVRLGDLVGKGDASANVAMRPGDIVMIPEGFFAGAWTADGTISGITSYTDNVGLDPDGERDPAVITAVQPTISIRGQTARVTAALDAGVTAGYQYISDEGPVLLPEMIGLTTIELSRDLIFFDGAASVTTETLDSGQGSSGAAGSTGNLDIVQAYVASPYVLNRLGSVANMETRYLFGAVKTNNADIFGNDSNSSQNNDELSDAIINGFSVGVASGRDFTRTPWLFRIGGERISRFDASTVDQAYAVLSPEYVVTSTFSLLGDFGYEALDDGDRTLDGPTALGGFRWRPALNLEMRALYGRRLDNNAGEAEVRYDIGPRTSLVAFAEERVETGQQSLIQNVGSVGLNPATGEFIDRRTDLAYIPRPTSVTISDTLTRTRRGQVTLTHSVGLNTFSASAFATDQEDLGNNQDDNSGNNQNTWGFGAGWVRQLDSQTALDVRARYDTGDNASNDRNDSSSGGGYDRYQFWITLDRTLTENVTGYISYRFQTQTARDRNDEFTENAVVIGLTYGFNL